MFLTTDKGKLRLIYRRLAKETIMARFHDGMTRLGLHRYVEITAKPKPDQTGWYSVTLAIRDEEKDTEIEVMDESMTLNGAKSRASELALHHRIEDVVLCLSTVT
jgi:hypothetical protein